MSEEETSKSMSVEEPKVLEEKKYHDLSRIIRNKLVLGFLAFFILVFLPFIGFKYYSFAINRPAQLGRGTQFEIKKGELASEISQRLYDEGLVNSEFLFRFYLISNGYQKNIQAGVYEIPAGSSVKQLVNLFQYGTDSKNITFVEGWRVEQFALRASEVFPKVDYETFVLLAKEYEGFLFPDTYNFDSASDEKQLIDVLKKTFVLKTQNLLSEENAGKLGLSIEEIVTIASIVEREVPDLQDKKKVAGILLKRYFEGMMLGADATTQYLAVEMRNNCVGLNTSKNVCPAEEVAKNINWWPNDLLQTELDTESPYNTRKVVGIPPKPISSVSLSSIDAVINYEETPYYFYLTGKDGVTYYARTYVEHQYNIATHLR